jgi:hypothetical protein
LWRIAKPLIRKMQSADGMMIVDDTVAEKPRSDENGISLKQNAALERSPAHTVTTQTNHIFASLCAVIKLEKLKIKTQSNHFELKARLYVRAVQSAFDALRLLQPIKLAA